MSTALNKPVAIIQMGTPPADVVAAVGEPALWFCNALGLDVKNVLVVRPDLDQALPSASHFSLAIITGSWAMVTDRAGWSERTAAWAREMILGEHALLGICYGHQLMAHAMGGVVDYNPQGRARGVYSVQLAGSAANDSLLAGFPPAFDAILSHSQSVLQAPDGAQVLGGVAHDANQVIRYGENAFSMQFHPEFTPEIMQAIIRSGQARAARQAEPRQKKPLPIIDEVAAEKRLLQADLSTPPAILQRFAVRHGAALPTLSI